jgi:hypothetical protein
VVNTEVGTKSRTIIRHFEHGRHIVLALKAGGGVAVKIFDQKQEAARSNDLAAISAPPRACVTKK